MATGRIPSLNWLRVFEAAAEKGSFARAARSLNMTAPAVSQQIRALETHLGRDLFERGPRSVRLTAAGEAFLPTVAQALSAVETTAASLFGAPGAAGLTLRATLLLTASWLAERLPQFLALEPEIRLTLLAGNLEEDFARPGADLSIAFGQPTPPGYESDPLFGERLSPVAIPALARQIATPQDLLAHPLIEVATHRSNWFRLLPEGGRPRFLFTDNTVTAFALAASGAGVALARAPASDALMLRHGLIPCAGAGATAEGDQRYMLLYPARSRLSATAHAFRSWLIEASAAPSGA